MNLIDLDQNQTTPFIHRFQTAQNNKYIYDVNTMNIIKVDEVIWEIISDIGQIGKPQISSKYSNRFSYEQVDTAYRQIKAVQKEKGLFREQPLNESQIIVLAVLHASRDPKAWKERI